MSRHILAICFDFGDTLVDEATEVKDETLTTLRAELIPGAGSVVRELKQRGYPLALVADGRAGTYHNVLTQHGLCDLFDAFAISDLVGRGAGGVVSTQSVAGISAGHAQIARNLGLDPADYSLAELAVIKGQAELDKNDN